MASKGLIFQPKCTKMRQMVEIEHPPTHTHSASCTMGTGSIPGVKRPERGVDHTLPSSVEVKERVELYL
jgi:hypothetical protein